MRTTVNIDPFLLRDAKRVAQDRSCSLGQVLDQALRGLLAASDGSAASSYELVPYGTGGLRDGVDLEDREAMAELLGDNEIPAPQC